MVYSEEIKNYLIIIIFNGYIKWKKKIFILEQENRIFDQGDMIG